MHSPMKTFLSCLFHLWLVVPFSATLASVDPPRPDLTGTELLESDLDGIATALEFMANRPLTSAEKGRLWVAFAQSARQTLPAERQTALTQLREMFRQIAAARGQGHEEMFREMLRKAFVQSAQAEAADPTSPVLLELLAGQPPAGKGSGLRESAPANGPPSTAVGTSSTASGTNTATVPGVAAPPGEVLAISGPTVKLQGLVLPDAIAVAILELGELGKSEPVQTLWQTVSQVQPMLPENLSKLWSKLGIDPGRDLRFLVFSVSARASTLAVIGQIEPSRIIELASSEGMTLAATQNMGIPVYQAVSSPQGSGANLAVAFPEQGVLLGTPEAVAAALASTGGSTPSIIPPGEGILLTVALAGLQQVRTPQTGAQQGQAPAAQAMRNIRTLLLRLNAVNGVEIALDATFSDASAANLVHATIQQALSQLKVQTEKPDLQELAGSVTLARGGAGLGLRLPISKRLTRKLVRQLQRKLTAKPMQHPETGVTLQLPQAPYAWVLQPGQGGQASTFQAKLPYGYGAISVVKADLGPNAWSSTIQQVADWQKQNLGEQTLLSSRVSKEGETEVHLMETKMGGYQYFSVQFFRDAMEQNEYKRFLITLSGWSQPMDYPFVKEETDFVASRLLAPGAPAPPAQAGRQPAPQGGYGPGQAGRSGTSSTAAALLKQQQEMMNQQQYFTMMSNMLNMQHQTSMAIIHNMGSGYTYEYEYGP